MDETPPLTQATLYTMDELVAALGEPYVRKNVAFPPEATGSRRSPRARILAATAKPADITRAQVTSKSWSGTAKPAAVAAWR
jgi:hypothetical protein